MLFHSLSFIQVIPKVAHGGMVAWKLTWPPQFCRQKSDLQTGIFILLRVEITLYSVNSHYHSVVELFAHFSLTYFSFSINESDIVWLRAILQCIQCSEADSCRISNNHFHWMSVCLFFYHKREYKMFVDSPSLYTCNSDICSKRTINVFLI